MRPNTDDAVQDAASDSESDQAPQRSSARRRQAEALSKDEGPACVLSSQSTTMSTQLLTLMLDASRVVAERPSARGSSLAPNVKETVRRAHAHAQEYCRSAIKD
jgi:hypothetical protein